MSRNGAGVYSLPAGNPVVTGTTISSTWANNTLSDIATALTQSLAKDGQTVPTANIPLGGFKITGLGTPTTTGDSLAFGRAMGAISGTTGTFSGAVSGTTGTFSGAVSGTTGTFTNTLNVTGVSTLTAGSIVQGLTCGRGGGGNLSNTAFGFEALKLNSTGTSNIAVGNQALENNSTASANTAVGATSLLLNTTGASNTACGNGTLAANLIGNSNAALGANALLVATNNANTAVGATALSTLTTGINNTGIGFNAQPSTATVNNTITLGNSSIATLRCQVTSITALSDARDKKEILDIPAGLSFVQALRPVSFLWNMRDGAKIDVPEFGFIAQELQSAQMTTGITVPNLVSSENPEKLEASQSVLIPVLVKAIQELKAELDALKIT